jgi:hypothetical protein
MFKQESRNPHPSPEDQWCALHKSIALDMGTRVQLLTPLNQQFSPRNVSLKAATNKSCHLAGLYNVTTRM